MFLFQNIQQMLEHLHMVAAGGGGAAALGAISATPPGGCSICGDSSCMSSIGPLEHAHSGICGWCYQLIC